jgi:hypothetical protein
MSGGRRCDRPLPRREDVWPCAWSRAGQQQVLAWGAGRQEEAGERAREEQQRRRRKNSRFVLANLFGSRRKKV